MLLSRCLQFFTILLFFNFTAAQFDEPCPTNAFYDPSGVYLTLLNCNTSLWVKKKIVDVAQFEGYLRPNSTTFVVTHGWMGNTDPDHSIEALAASVQQSNCANNVLLLTWYSDADVEYTQACRNVKCVGFYLAKALTVVASLKQFTDLPDFLLMGHSLGGHVIGFCATYYYLGKLKLYYIDLAGPLWLDWTHITANAKTSQALITDPGLFGTRVDLGGVQIYAVPVDECQLCLYKHYRNHMKAIHLLTDCINNVGSYQCLQCDSGEKFLNGSCNSNDKISMCGKIISNNAPAVAGKYYINTASEDEAGAEGGQLTEKQTSMITSLMNLLLLG